ncbi:hypothetical protein [Marilutibacter chinensis]|nr:hypothetical protein [Lysobacter chinensis]
MKMAGHTVAHAIWSVSDGEVLIPIVGHLGSDGGARMERLAMGSAQAMAMGAEKISRLEPGTTGAVFVKDTLVTLESGKVDALVADIRFAANDASRLQLLVPYRNANHADGFAVHAIKLTELAEIPRDAVDGLMQAFVAGLESHQEGGRLWAEKYVAEAGATAGEAGEQATEFSPDEFDVLKRSVFMVFAAVAASDGKIEKKEAETFVKTLGDAELLRNPLMNRIVTNVIHDIPGIMASIFSDDAPSPAIELLQARLIVDAKLPADEAGEFKQALLGLGHAIASASGGGLFGFGSRISKDEKQALAAIAACLGVSAQ